MPKKHDRSHHTVPSLFVSHAKRWYLRYLSVSQSTSDYQRTPSTICFFKLSNLLDKYLPLQHSDQRSSWLFGPRWPVLFQFGHMIGPLFKTLSITLALMSSESAPPGVYVLPNLFNQCVCSD